MGTPARRKCHAVQPAVGFIWATGARYFAATSECGALGAEPTVCGGSPGHARHQTGETRGSAPVEAGVGCGRANDALGIVWRRFVCLAHCVCERCRAVTGAGGFPPGRVCNTSGTRCNAWKTHIAVTGGELASCPRGWRIRRCVRALEPCCDHADDGSRSAAHSGNSSRRRSPPFYVRAFRANRRSVRPCSIARRFTRGSHHRAKVWPELDPRQENRALVQYAWLSRFRTGGFVDRSADRRSAVDRKPGAIEPCRTGL